MQIIAFAEEHTDSVTDLIILIQREEFDIPITAADQPDLTDIPDFYQTRNGNFWLALEDNKVIGTIGLLDIGNNQGALRKMFVHRDYRGPAGTALLLFNTLLTHAQERGMSEILLGTTSKFLAAHRFYEKHGFTRIDKADLPPAFPVMAVDTVFYRCTLPR